MSECRTLFVGAVTEGRRCLDAMIAWGEPFAGLVTVTETMAAKTSGAVPFDDVARKLRIPLLKVADLNTPAAVEEVRGLRPDLILVIGWTRLLAKELLTMPRLGAIGFHASLLPRYRGRAPVNWAIINGERETGNTMFFLDEGVDTGDVIAQRAIRISEEDDCATLYEKVAVSATEMLRENLPLLKEGRAPRHPQDHSLATVMPRRRPEDGRIDWRRSTRELYDWVRALTHPYPGAFTDIGGRRLHVWRARCGAIGESNSSVRHPGRIHGVTEDSLVVETGDGLLELTGIQWAGQGEKPDSDLVELPGACFDRLPDPPAARTPPVTR